MHIQKTSLPGWVARILCILAILFVSMFALDAFSEGDNFFEKLGAFGIHLIPSVVLALILWLTWKHELAGGILFCLIGIGLAPFIYQMNYDRTGSTAVALQVIGMINLPFVIVGVLFIISYFRQRSKQKMIIG